MQEAIDLVNRKGELFDSSKVDGLDVGNALNDYQMGKSTPATQALSSAYRRFYGVPEPAARAAFKLPADVAKSAPRFGMAQLQFASDLDRAAYIIRNKAKASKGEARIIKALEDQGYDIPEIRARGDEVKTLIQDVIEEQTGSRAAPSEAMTLQIPDTDAPGIRASQSMPQASAGDAYDEAAFRKAMQPGLDAKAMAEEAALMDIGLKIPNSVVRMVGMSCLLYTSPSPRD